MGLQLRARLAAIAGRDSIRLAGLLAVVAAVAILYRDGTGAQAVAEANPGRRVAMAELSAPDLAGNRWSLAGERGSIVLVNFWASWCPPCRAETPALVRVSNEYRQKGVRVVGVSMDDSIDPVRNFVAHFRVPYTVVMPETGSSLVSAIESLPTSFLVDRHGRVAKTYLGAVEEDDLARDLDALLREP
jgi:cytochrome c biogenesis protein CcmG/thiol:disulfide interchange protein DsbE